EGGRARAYTVFRRGPETRRIGGKHLVDQKECAPFIQAELELRVGYDDARRFRKRRGLTVELYRYRADFLRHLRADDLAGLGKGNVFVVLAGRPLGCGREYPLRQLLSLSQPRRELDAAHHSRLLVVLPPGADDVAAHHRLDQQRLEL